MMHPKLTIRIAVVTAIMYALWEIIGHRFMMGLPMAHWHLLSGFIGAGLALILAAAVAHTILRQHQELAKLARLRDYLFRMERHYLRMPETGLLDPAQYYGRKERETRFMDAQQGLSDANSAVRAKAVVLMADLATEGDSGQEDPHPFIRRASAHLSAALYLEHDPAVGGEVVKAIDNTISFAAESDHALFRQLVGEIAHANRTALTLFFSTLSRYLRSDDSKPPDFAELAALAPLMDVGSATIDLRDMLSSPDFKRAVAVAEPGHSPTDEVRTDANVLIRTRDVLAAALRRALRPQDCPTDDSDMRLWHPSHPLPLDGCFLAHANLREAHLEGTNISFAWLAGVNMMGAQLQKAVLRNSHLAHASLESADLSYSDLHSACLRAAGLSNSTLAGASLMRAEMQGAYLIGAQLQGATLWNTEVEDVGSQPSHAEFTRANWWDARFTDPLSLEEDRKLPGWLEARFPKPKADNTIGAPVKASRER